MLFIASYLGRSMIGSRPADDCNQVLVMREIAREALHADDPELRIAACVALSSRRCEVSARVLDLLEPLLRDQEATVRSAAARAQGLILKAMAQTEVSGLS